MMNNVDEFLAEHGFSRKKVAQFVTIAPVYNLKRGAKEAGMGEATAHRYRNALQELDEETREDVIAALVTGRGDQQ